MINWILRDAVNTDIPYIMSTWLKSSRRQGDRAFMTNTVYFANEKRRIGDILERAQTLVLANPVDHDHIIGWVCFELIADVFLLHYVYIKRDYQKNGYAKKALERIFPAFGLEQIGVTDITGIVAAKREKYRLHYNPYLTKLGQ